jgi:hypothetical protein
MEAEPPGFKGGADVAPPAVPWGAKGDIDDDGDKRVASRRHQVCNDDSRFSEAEKRMNQVRLVF